MTTQNVVKNPLPSLSRHFISFSPFYIIIYSLLQVVQKHKLGKVGSETIILNQYTSAAAEVQWLRQPIWAQQAWIVEAVVTTEAISRVKLQSNHHPQHTNTQLCTGRMPFPLLNQQRQSTEGNERRDIIANS